MTVNQAKGRKIFVSQFLLNNKGWVISFSDDVKEGPLRKDRETLE